MVAAARFDRCATNRECYAPWRWWQSLSGCGTAQNLFMHHFWAAFRLGFIAASVCCGAKQANGQAALCGRFSGRSVSQFW